MTAAAAVRASRSAHGAVEAKERSDATLLEQARGGDAAAFAAIYDRHAAAAYSLVRRKMHARSAAQEVVQESFLALWRTDRYCADKGSLRNFLLGIVRNRAIDALRRERRRKTEEHSDEAAVLSLPASDRTDAEVEQRDAQRLLRAAVAALPEAQHQALELAYFEGLTHARSPCGSTRRSERSRGGSGSASKSSVRRLRPRATAKSAVVEPVRLAARCSSATACKRKVLTSS